MRYIPSRKTLVIICTCLSVNLIRPSLTEGQETQTSPAPIVSAGTKQDNIGALVESVRQLQTQLQGLNSQIVQLRAEERTAYAEIIALRKELSAAKGQSAYVQSGVPIQESAQMYSSPVQLEQEATSSSLPMSAKSSIRSAQEKIDNLEEGLQLANQKINEQSQTKVESGSKYRLRLSGIVLLNIFSNRGTVDNVDFPEFATPRPPFNSNSSFGGTLRQSQITMEAFGPDIAGAHTSADLKLDFAGGFPSTSNGTNMGIVRLRTGTVRFAWSRTSIVAGQDNLFFSPLSPTSLASLAVPMLSYSGNLWAWTPQVRIEHRLAISDDSSLLLQAGVLTSTSGEITDATFDRFPTQGEQSGQPGYAARIAWSERLFGQAITAGIGGYYGRQNWGMRRTVNGWVGSADLVLPLGKNLELSGEFYRGNAVGGFGGAIGQTVLLSGPLSNAGTNVQGVNSMGGWVQLKLKPTPKFEVNAAFGDDNPFSSELRSFHINQSFTGPLLSKNLSPFVNFIYQPRSDVVFSAEYRHLKTYIVDSNPHAANLINLSVGYIF
jgi:hypothetical protein